MSWRLRWSAAATNGLLHIGWHQAERVDAAILEFARSGKGNVVRLPTDDAVTVRLRVPPHAVRLSLDPFEGVMHVWAVYRVGG
jgi:hypothetical protein